MALRISSGVWPFLLHGIEWILGIGFAQECYSGWWSAVFWVFFLAVASCPPPNELDLVRHRQKYSIGFLWTFDLQGYLLTIDLTSHVYIHTASSGALGIILLQDIMTCAPVRARAAKLACSLVTVFGFWSSFLGYVSTISQSWYTNSLLFTMILTRRKNFAENLWFFIFIFVSGYGSTETGWGWKLILNKPSPVETTRFSWASG